MKADTAPWTEFAVGEHVKVVRVWDPPHPMTGTRVDEFGGALRDVSQFGYMLHGDSHFYSWDPGPRCTSTVTKNTEPVEIGGSA